VLFNDASFKNYILHSVEFVSHDMESVWKGATAAEFKAVL